MNTHRVPATVFDELAGGGGDMSGVLRAGQRSKRLLMLHELASTARARAPEAFADARAAESFAVLADAHRRRPDAVDEVVLQPAVGAWVTACLRDLLGGRLPATRLGQLGAVAASAAVRAGQDVEVTAHVGGGSVMLPTFGLARVGGGDGWCRIRSRAGARGVELTASGTTTAVPLDGGTGETGRATERWLPLRRLRSSAGGIPVDVVLDDLDPYRDCAQLSVTGRLDDAAVEDWQRSLDEAWALLVAEHPADAEAIAGGVTSIVPLQPAPGAEELSATCHEASGAVATTPPRRPLSLALALVHEFQHTKLSALLDLVPLLDRAPGASLYAPWRADPRPLAGLLQGTYAFLGLTRFWEAHRGHRGRAAATGGASAAAPDAGDAWPEFEFALGRRQVRQAVDALAGSGRLRPPGARFVDGMRRRLAELERLPVPAAPRALARLACCDHGISWRLRNVRTGADAVAEAADAWLSARPCPWTRPPPATVADGGGPIPSAGRSALVRQRLAFPDRWRDEADGCATPADVLLVAGDVAAAAAAYRSQLAAGPDDLASWAGLALAHRERPIAAAWALTEIPEAVHALHGAIRARSGAGPDPVELAAWAARSAGP